MFWVLMRVRADPMRSIQAKRKEFADWVRDKGEGEKR